MTADNLKFIAPLLFCLIASLYAESEFLSHLEAVIHSGISIPQGELSEKLENQPLAGIVLRSPYYKQFNCHFTFHFAPLEGDGSLPEAGTLKLAVGLAYSLPQVFIPRIGFELGNYTMIIRDETAKHTVEYESEFGACPFLFWRLPFLSKGVLQAGFEWDMIFNHPQYSHFLNLKAGVGWKLW